MWGGGKAHENYVKNGKNTIKITYLGVKSAFSRNTPQEGGRVVLSVIYLVGDGELSKVVPDHLRLYLHLVEGLPVVHSDNRAGHLGDDDHVTKVGLHHVGLLVDRAFLLLLAELLDQGHRLPL